MVDTARNIADLSPEKLELLEMLVQEEGDELICCPLSFAQQRLWFLDQLEPGNPVYNLPTGVRLRGALELPALQQSLNEIIRRHEALRTRFTVVDDQPVQVIDPEFELPLEVIDLSTLNEDEREIEALRLTQVTATGSFDLTTGPLLRATLLRLAAADHLLLFTMHHIISDGWSMGVLVQEVGALYRAFSAGSASPLPALPIQYADYAVWQREQLTTEFLAEQLSYWREQLSGAPAVLGLPTDRVRPAVKSYRGARERVELSAALTAALKAMSREQGVTLFMVLLAAFKVLLWRYAGQADVVVGTPIANRQQSELEGLIGFFVNTLALRTQLVGAESFHELLQRVREVCLGAYQHQDVPFEMVVEELGVERALNQTPLFQVMFVLQNTPASELRLEDIELSVLEVASGTAKFELLLTMREDESGLRGQVEYATDLFESASIRRLVGHYERLLQELVRDGAQAVGAVPLLGAAEREQLLSEWNQTNLAVPESCVHELFAAQVERTPEAVAVVFEEQQLSYGELNRRANQLAHHLRGLGVGPEVLVGVLLERSFELVVALLGILKAGAAYLPLDPEYPGERLSFMLADAEVPVLLTLETLLERVPANSARVVCLDRDWAAISVESEENPRLAVSPENQVYVIYTSGSTGQPKGVQISHRAICNHLQWRQHAYPLSGSDRFLQKASIGFDISVWEIFGPLLAGSQLLLAKPGGQRESAYLRRLIAAEKVTVAHFSPAMLQVWLQETELEQCQDLRQVFCGGEPLTVAQRNSFFTRLQVGLCHQYGPTEATVDALIWDCHEDDGEVIPLGRPIANMRAYVLDEELQPVPIGVAGELHLAGVGLARGYLKRADLTAAQFIPDPFSEPGGERLYKTGDRVRYLAEGALEYLGRLDQQVKIRGFRVELGEIEAVLNEHPLVRQSVTVARADVAGDKRLVSYLVATAPVESGELRRHLKQQLPDYMIPAAFVLLEALPLMPNGKIDRRALPAPGPVQVAQASPPTQTPIAEIITGICAHLLKCEAVSGAANFFEIGGHSLLATQLVARLRDSLGLEIPVRWVFQSSTLAELAERVEAEFAKEGAASHIAAIRRRGENEERLPLSFAQQRLWFLDQLEPGNPVYNIPGSVHLTGPLNLSAVSQSLNEIIRRHEALRTRFTVVDDQPVQVIDSEFELPLEVVDLSTLNEDERETEALRLTQVTATGRFDLTTGPLLRATLLRLGAEDHLLLFTMHHIISDGWSMGVLVQEVGALYRAFSEGSASPLPALPIQYADYAVWQREQLTTEFLAEQLSYWREQLSGAPAVLGLPTDRVRPAVKSYRGARERVELSAELTAGLKGLSREQGVTLFMVLLAAFKVLLWRYAGQADVVVGTPIANRQQSELEGLIGFFVNTLALRTQLAGGESFHELLQRVREVCLGAYQHQDVPFEMVVEELGVERALNQTPLFQVMFVLQNTPASELRLEDVELSVLEVASGTAKFDLLLTMREDESGLSGQVEYDTDLFESASIRRLVGHYEKLLEELVRDGAQAVGAVPLLGAAEREQLLSEWNQTSLAVPDSCVHELFAAQVERTPEAVAVVFAEQQLSYGELNRRANQLAHYLRGLGVGPEVRVGVLLERNVEMIVALLGILKAGGAFVPLDPTYPQERIAFMLADAGVAVLLTQANLRQNCGDSGARVVCLEDEWPLIRQGSIDPAGGSRQGNLAYVIYTSGSSGLPKGVAIEHGSLSNYLCWVNESLFAGRRYNLPFVTGLSFDASLKQVFAPLLRGDQVWMLPNDIVSDPSALLSALNTRSNVALNCVPSLWAALLNSVPESEIANRIQSLRCLFIGGESLSPELLDRTFEALPQLEVWNLYGPTESTANAVSSRITPGKKPLIGRPIANTEAYVLDSNLQPVPIGVVGELYIGGVGLARGYLGRPELTAERFVPHTFSSQPGQRLYRTGDLACFREDGRLEYLGRLDQQVKIRGFRVELGEIEAVLNEHPLVRQSVTIARADVAGEKRLVSYLVATAPVESSELRRHLKQQLPDYMIPAVFVLLEALPLMPNGKIDRRALPAPGPVQVAPASATTQTPIAEIITGICAHLLKCEAVSGAANFFEIGGHSLLATQLVARLRDSLGLEIPVRWVFQSSTLVELAERVEAEFAKEGAASHIAAIRRRGESEERLPLSFAQQRLWFLDQLEPGNPVYNIPGSVRLTGPLNLSAVSQSLNEIIRRHEALRTRFTVVDDQPVQVIDPELELRLEVIDLSKLNEDERETEALRLTQVTATGRFDLTTGPLLRATLLRLAAEDHLLLFTMHHIISDGWSMGVLVQEVGALYRAFSEGSASPLPGLPIQYADYAVWQREQLTTEFLAEQLSYWREQLSGAPAVLGLPTDRVRPAVKSYRGARERVELSAALTAGLKAMSREQGVTLFMVLLAAFKVLLWRYAGQADVVVGTPIANRQQSELEGLIGFFVNTLALRTQLVGGESFHDLLKRVREVCLGAYQHQDVPFEMVVEELGVERALNQTPLFQVMFVLQNTPASELRLEDIELSVLEVASGTAKFELLLTMREDESGLSGQVEYDTDLFEGASIRRLVGHYERLLEELVRDGAQAVGTVPLLGAAEREQLLYEWNQTSLAVPESCVHELFAAQVERTPEAVAVLFEEQQLSYGELNRRANQLAHYLRGLGVGPEVRVGVCLERNVEMIVALLGILKAGGAYVPLDPNYPQERLSFMLADAQAKVLLTQESLRERLPEWAAEIICVDRDRELIGAESSAEPRPCNQPDNLAYLIYTSGSTGRPKGVSIEHRNAVTLLHWAREVYTAAEYAGVLASTSICFDLSVFEFFVPLSWGGKVIIAENALQLPLLAAAAAVTLINTVPSAMAELAREGGLPASVRVVNLAGEPLKRSLVDAVYGLAGVEKVCNLYGPSEDTTYSTFVLVPEGEGGVTIGRPVANTSVYLLNEQLEPVPVGVAAELCIGGAGLARGYHGRSELTAERFVPNPFSATPGARLYRTGDVARYLANGELDYLGRVDQQVKLRGFRIELGEVETVLEQHEGIKQAVVVAREAEAGGKLLVAYLVAREGEAPGTAALRAYLKQRLPEYMAPAAFVYLAALPLTTTGKINRKALPEPGRAELSVGYVGPRTETEALVSTLWAGILKQERVGIYDNFFELGGHSLLATQLRSRLCEAFQVEIPLRLLFEQPTVAGLTQSIENELPVGRNSSPIQRLSLAGPQPLSFAQQRLWFLDQLTPGNSSYNLVAALHLKGLLNVSALEQSIGEVVRRHEALRTTFVVSEGEPSQVIAPALSLVQSVVDISALAETERDAEVQRLIAEEGRRPFDLAHGPLLRVKLLRLAADEQVALFTMHHIISDGWSMGVLIQELAALYQAFLKEQPSPLPALPIQYADYAVWQREQLTTEFLAEQLSYWREQLSGAPAVLGLPTDRVRPGVKSYRGARERVELSAALTAGLKGLSREQGVTLFMVLLAAFKVLLWRYAGQADVVVGTPIANRQQSELEGLIGFFVNTLALRTQLVGGESFHELLKRVREVCLGAYQHQDVPFEMVVEELGVERALNQTPLFQVMFVLQNTPASELRLEDIELSVLEVASGTAKFELLLTMREDESGLSGQVEYDTDLFEGASIRRLVGHYERLLEELVRDGAQAVGTVPLLGAAEREQLLYEWNQTSLAVPESCVHELFAAQVERTPEAVAVLFEEQQLSYGELNRRANQLAHYLRGLGVGPEVRVGVCLERNVEMIVALLGILKAGGAYVPLDPNYPQERLSFMLADAQAKVLLTQESLRERLPEWAAEIICVDRDRELIGAESSAEPRPCNQPDNLAYLIYTSGSTGRPKGVSIEHRNAVTLLHWAREVYTAAEYAGVLASTSICFDLSVFEFFVPLSWGGKVIIAENALQLPLLAAAAAVTLINTVPSAMAELAREGGLPASVRVVNLAGEPLKRSLVDAVYGLAGVEKVCNLYGPSEDTTYSTFVLVPEGEGGVTIGRPVANTSVYLLNEQLEPVPVGVAAELCIGGAGLARGYHGRSELTAERFVPNPFSATPGARLYRTGDVARYLANGELDYLGRVDQQVKLRGFRIELGEVETVLEQHEGIKQAVVVAREAEAGGKLLVAYLVAREGEAPGTAALRAYLKQRLPEYMAPAAFVYLAALPLTTTGKINRNALPEPGRPELSIGYVGPRTETEALVSTLWAGILKQERVGIYDNFFELGGHSLLATQLRSRLCEAFQVEIPLRLLFEQPTVAGLTQSIENELPVGRNSSPIQRLSLAGPQPLSFAQQRLWFLDQLTPGNSSYNMPSAIRLSGSFNPLALQQTFNEILRRQELLRTSFAVIDAEPMQIVSEPVDFDLPVVDLSHFERPEIERQVQLLASEEAHRPFDLTRGPLFRVTLLRLTAAEHVLLFTMPHIISDGWSMRVLIKEMTTIYEALSAGRPSRLMDLPVQYGDFAAWQREQLQGEILEEQLQYWREQLQGAPVLLELPTENPRPPVQSYRGARHTLEIAPQTTRALKQLSQQHSVTLFMTLLAAFQALLYRYTGQDDIVVGTPVAGRTRRETEGLIGLFLNTLALRVSLKDDPTFATLLSRVRDACLGAYAHQDVPFERLLEELAPERSLSHTPIFQVMFNMLNLDSAGEQTELDGLTIDPLPLTQHEPGAKFELELYVREQGDGLHLHLVYSELYTSVAMEQLLEHLHTLLQAVATEPSRHLSTLPLSTDLREQRPNRDNLIRPTNQFVTFANEEIEQTIQERFEKQVRSNPGNIAINTRKESWTYKELNHTTNQIARAVLAASGDGDQRIALLLNHDAWMVAGILGVLKAGKTYVPLDASYPRQRLMDILEDSEAAGLLTNNANLLFAEELIPEGLPIINLDQLDLSTPADDLQVQCTPDSLAYLLYTSGSTGKPKGVVQNQRNVLHHIRSYTNNLHICANDKLTLFSSYAVDAAVQDIFGALLNGATVCPIDVRAEDLNRILARLNEQEITIFHSTPTVYRYFVNSLRDQETCPSVRLVVLGGEEVQTRDFELYRKHFSPACLLVNGLGLTESTIGLQYFVNQDTEITHDTLPVGHAVENTEVSLFNEAGEQFALYGVGEIIIKSPHVALGYWRQPELTQKAFPTAFVDGTWRSYHTGDLGRWLPNGTIEYVGRRDNQVKIRGHRVELGEVEAALRTCREVSECAVVMRPGERLVAYVVLRESEKGVNVSEWRQQLEERLPQYMVPSVFMVIDKMPLTATGKVYKRGLPEVETSRAELGNEYESARTPTEKTLISIWRKVLDVEQVGIHDNFFKLGGHSLLATQVVSRIRDLFRVELPLRYVFEYPTVNSLAAKIDAADIKALIAPPIIPVMNGGPIPLSFAQQRLWFLDQLESNKSLYNRPAAYLLKGQLKVEALEYSINEVVHRHASLRTYFVTSDHGSPAQQILPPAPFDLPQRDLQHLPEPERELEVRRLITEEGQKPFQLSRAPLLRCLLLRTAKEEHVFILTIHHIVTDGWSMSLFLNELAVSYESYLEQRPASLPELTVQYADFAVWQRNWLRGEVFDRLLNYWQQQLKGAPARLELPADKPRPAIQTHSGAKQFASLSPQLTESLKELSRHEDATLYMTMLACFNTLLHYYTGQNDIVIGTDVANRNRGETELLIGFFVNELVMRTDLTGNPTFRELVGRVREVALGAYNHQDMPFDRLVDALKIERSPAYHPLFQVSFVMQNTPAISVEVKSLTISTLPVENPIAVFDLVFRAWENGRGMQLMLEYNADLFMQTTITRLLDLFETLAGIVVQQPEARLTTLVDTLAQADRARLFDKGKALEAIGSRSLKKAKRRAVATQ